MKHFISRRNFLKAAGVTAAASAMAAAVPQASAGFLTGKDAAVTILYTNDVHTYIDNKSPKLTYAAIAAMKQGYVDEGKPVLLVDAGDHIQGTAYGSMDNGATIIELMNEAGYDIATLGNHEFDYGMARAKAIIKEADFPYVSCNWVDLRTGLRVLPAVKLFPAGGKWIAFVGITTPESFTKSTPAYFMNAKQTKYIYDILGGDDGRKLYDAVQKAIDKAKTLGADIIIGLGHLGVDPSSSPWTSEEVIANTTGFDAFIDGHSHSTFSETIKDKSGKEVVFEQTGTKLANVGKIIIKADGTITHENVDLNTVDADAEAAAYIQTITDKFDALQKQVVAKTSVELTINGADGKRAVRNAETNLGDLCADAYRILLGADIAFVNGGGVRDNIKVGDITYGDIIKVHPFGNEACLVEVTGQQIKDALELGSAAYPGESGGFLQVSGLTYTINADIPSSVVKNDKSEFVKVDGAYRVSDIMVGGQPLDVNKTYTLASHNYMLKQGGDGYAMFGTDNVKLLKDGVMIDNQVLINYIVNNLGGVVGEQYAAPQGRITIKTAASDVPTNESDKVIAGRDTTVTEGDTYTVVAGDCLWNIAYKLYGTGTLYTKLAEANKLADPYIIYIGQILTVPAK